MRRNRWALLVVAALAVGIAARASFLVWSPLPATLDAFRYARLADHIVETGQLLGAGVESDELVTTLLLAVGSEVTGMRPLYLAQPLVACVGGASVLAGIVLVRILGRRHGWHARRTFHASVVATLALAASGMYLRRTGVPDEEAIALLFLPLFALACHRTFTSRRIRWALPALAIGLAYPPTHNMSSLVAAVTLTGLVAIHVSTARTRRDVGIPLVAGGAFWAYFFGYFIVAEQFGLELTYSGLLSQNLGAFIAWVVVAVVGIVWLRSTSPRAVRSLFGVGIGVWFAVATANLFVPVFPGTVQTPPLVLGLVALYVVPVALFAWWLPSIVGETGDVPVVVALLVGPVAVGWFALSTSLTPEFWGTVMRVQVHAHAAAFVLAATGAVAVAASRPRLGRLVVTALVLATVLSAPFAFVHLDTGTAPRTVHSSEFSAISFASTNGVYASDHRLARPGPQYYGDVSGQVGPTRTWFEGGPPPSCLTLAQRAWTTDAAHFYPTPPQTLDLARFEQWYEHGNLVYSVGGTTETYVVASLDGEDGC